MRIDKARDERMRKFADEFAADGVNKHANLSRDLSEDYKRRAVDQAIVELYCNDGKYRTKYKELIEKSEPAN